MRSAGKNQENSNNLTLPRGASEMCAVLSLIACIANIPFGLSLLIEAHKSRGMHGLQDMLNFVFGYPILSWCGSLLALAGLFGKHNKRRIAFYSFLFTLIMPIVSVCLYLRGLI